MFTFFTCLVVALATGVHSQEDVQGRLFFPLTLSTFPAPLSNNLADSPAAAPLLDISNNTLADTTIITSNSVNNTQEPDPISAFINNVTQGNNGLVTVLRQLGLTNRLGGGDFASVLKFGLAVIGSFFLLSQIILPFLGIEILAPGRRSFRNLIEESPFFSNIMRSLDPVEMAFKFMDIEDEDCRQKSMCEFNQKIADNSFVSSILNAVSESLPFFDRYREAMDFGGQGYECPRIYWSCNNRRAGKTLKLKDAVQ